MPTVIIGAGIIGVSTAYYLSQPDLSPKESVHLIEASLEPFASASGFAGGFLAADWFATPLSKLGQLSFDLHKQLAVQHNGHERWGYSQSTSTSLTETSLSSNGGSEADWLTEGVSRAIAAESTDPPRGHVPKWLHSKGRLDVLSDGDSTAQINPRHLCDFLISTCLSRGVHLHQPARPVAISWTPDGSLSGIIIRNSQTSKETMLRCTKLIIAAGAWSPQIFSSLFPKSKLKIPIMSLAGHALLLRSLHWPPPLDATDPANANPDRPDCHAVFTTDTSGGYSPEIFSRMPNGEIYLAGLNSSSYPLPSVAHERSIDPLATAKLKETAKRLLGDEVEVLRESVCWRPVTKRGVPIVAELAGKMEGKEGKGVFLAAGHGAWGISLSLGTGHCVARMVEERDCGEYVGGLGF